VAETAFTGVEQELGITAACRLTGRSRATHYRALKPPPVPKPRAVQVQPSALTVQERAVVLELMNSPQYAELPPAQIWARELDEGRYHCSVSTMYRILREHGQSGERRRQATHPAKSVPELVASAPSQVFTWDITKLAGPDKGIWYHAYVIIDIFSRYIVGHTVERAESAERAEELIRDTIERNGIVPETVHADRGTSMTSKKVSQLLVDLGVTRSHSRPRVSNDNPYSEAQFRTTKYMADYPERFDSLAHAREWFDAFTSYYNHERLSLGVDPVWCSVS
jgi:putative transposase